jgi:N-alpha-acetyltransferase 35, NatC auxiliary subunit
MVELKFEDAVDRLRHMCAECIEARRIVDVLSAQQPTSAENLNILLLSFSSRTPEPLPYGRACLSGPILGCDDATFQEFLATNLAETVLPADSLLDPVNWTFEAPPPTADFSPDPRYQVATAISRFTETAVAAVGGYVDFYKALLSNRCRFRRNLCRVVLGLEQIQTAEAGELDAVLMRHAPPDSVRDPLGKWLLQKKLRAMEMICQLGFELEVYLEEELAEMYW